MKQQWIIIIVVCAIYCIIMNPIAKVIKRKVSNKSFVMLLNFVIGFIILMILYGIAHILGYSIFE